MSDVPLCLIVAMADNRVIGRDNGLPWHLTDDLKFFKRQTLGKPLIMGRKTHDSIGKPLPGRPNIVVTRDPAYQGHGDVQVVHDVRSALQAARQFAAAQGASEIMVIGGAQIYRESLPLADRLYVTEVHLKPEGDTLFPPLPSNVWREVSRESVNDQNGTAMSFVRLDRRPES
ncbi:MAG: dihydrofolate reductase [Pseudomonadota bacterium]